jgi:4,5-dihydroxyphthalate decarboxylase
VRKDSGIQSPKDLAGKKVGLPEWAQTAAIYSRGLLAHEYGVDLKSIAWFQAGVNDAGRKEKVRLQLPAGLSYTPMPHTSLSAMLLSGEVDAVLSARPPQAFVQHPDQVQRLIPNYREVEQAYWKKTGIFPIMHVMAIKRTVFEQNPWIATNLLEGFEAAKERSVERAKDITASSFPLPWISDYAAQSEQIMGPDIWPYGIDHNHKTLSAFAQYAFEQGVTHRKMEVEELFPPQVQAKVKV